ncbi:MULTISPECIES: hypothetical protein [unclassified Luteibacter]|uniref:hypothetical protein n=1 Tax=Luteibacter sp. PvP019 TaxID=3156436 RepID=UPI0033932EE2
MSIVRRDAHDARMVLGKGANPHLEFERIDLLAERSVRCGTAMTLATLSDSHRGMSLMVRVLLDTGARVDQVDSKGRVLLDFATSPAVIDFLDKKGAPPATGLDA